MAQIKLKKDPWQKGVPPEVKVTKEGFEATDDLVNYKDFLVEHIGNPASLMTKAGLQNKLDAAHDAYISALFKKVAEKA